MPNQQDINALHALSDALADTGEVHRAASRVADDQALAATLGDRAKRLESLSREVRNGLEGEPGSMLALLDRLRLSVDQWFGDDDEAAANAGRDAKAKLLALIEDYAADQELAPDIHALFRDIRDRIGGTAVPAHEGLAGLPN